jgi:hypothetical protein
VTDLKALREHMRDAHGLEVAHMLPQRVLLSMHEEEDHGPESQDPPWYGSSDASSNPGFIARRSA